MKSASGTVEQHAPTDDPTTVQPRALCLSSCSAPMQVSRVDYEHRDAKLELDWDPWVAN
jgi:hypothetical protein